MNEFLEELNEYVNYEEAKEFGYNGASGFTIDNDDTANYFVKKIKEIRDEKERIEQTAAEAIVNYTAKVDRYKESKLSPLTFEETMIMERLRDYTESKLKDSKKRSIKLIEGTVGFKKRQPLFSYDDDSIIEFLRQDDTLYKKYVALKPSLKKNELKKEGMIDIDNSFKLNGIVVPGVHVESCDDSFDVK